MHQYHMPSYADVCIFVKAIWNIKKLEAYWVGGCGGEGEGGGIQFLDFNVPSGGTGPPQHIKLAKN